MSKPRKVAKALITVDPSYTGGERQLVFVAGKSGRFSLPGGGMNRDEKRQGEAGKLRALYRELEEETGQGADAFTGFEETLPAQEQGITSASGRAGTALWYTYIGGLLVPPSELHIPEGSEITKIACEPPEAFLKRTDASKLAQLVVGMALEHDLIAA